MSDYDEACERAGASLRPPLNHGSRKVTYHVRAVRDDIAGIASRLDRLIADINVAATDTETWGEVVVLRRYLREAQWQITHVLDANALWGQQGALASFAARGSSGTSEPATQTPQREGGR